VKIDNKPLHSPIALPTHKAMIDFEKALMLVNACIDDVRMLMCLSQAEESSRQVAVRKRCHDVLMATAMWKKSSNEEVKADMFEMLVKAMMYGCQWACCECQKMFEVGDV
jgi:hypothetical protein